jgi:hypothetical protein
MACLFAIITLSGTYAETAPFDGKSSKIPSVSHRSSHGTWDFPYSKCSPSDGQDWRLEIEIGRDLDESWMRVEVECNQLSGMRGRRKKVSHERYRCMYIHARLTSIRESRTTCSVHIDVAVVELEIERK